MRLLAKCIGLLAIAVGLTGVLSPGTLIAIGYHALTPLALYMVAAFRIAIGLVLIAVASGARMPKTMRVLGTVILLAGLATPFVGIAHSRAMLDWWAGGGVVFLRLSLCLAIATGALILYGASPRRQGA